MSNTRNAETGSPFRQEKFASSAALERGLMANLVAKRCETLTRPADLEMIWHLQLLSHAAGGLKKVAADLLAQFPERIATRSMRQFGFKAGQIYNADKVRQVRKELHCPVDAEEAAFWDGVYSYPLRGEESLYTQTKHPESYPAKDFVDSCRSAAHDLDEMLARLCLDPEINCEKFTPWYFPDLLDSLRSYLSAKIESRRAGAVVTQLGQKVNESLDYALALRGKKMFVLIDGLARTGKTHSVKAWCDLRPGVARYVQCPSSTDEIGFYRAIAKSLGVSINQNSKAHQLRDRIEDTLCAGDLVLVMDEAHYAWPQSNYRAALPQRINWLMTALVNNGVPLALVTTPQFMQTQKAVVRKSEWTSEQFVGRIGHYEKLPDSLSESDLEAVARAFVPEGCPRSIAALVAYAQGSAKYLAAIEAVALRSRYLAVKAGRDKVVFADMRSAIKDGVIPSDSALAVALAEPKRNGRFRAISAPLNDGLRGDKMAVEAITSRETVPVANGEDFRLSIRMQKPELTAA